MNPGASWDISCLFCHYWCISFGDRPPIYHQFFTICTVLFRVLHQFALFFTEQFVCLLDQQQQQLLTALFSSSCCWFCLSWIEFSPLFTSLSTTTVTSQHRKKIKNSNCLKKRSRNGSAGNWYRGVLAAAAVNPPIAHWPINNISSFSNSAQQRREIMGQQWTPVKYGAAPSTPPRPFFAANLQQQLGTHTHTAEALPNQYRSPPQHWIDTDCWLDGTAKNRAKREREHIVMLLLVLVIVLHSFSSFNSCAQMPGVANHHHHHWATATTLTDHLVN